MSAEESPFATLTRCEARWVQRAAAWERVPGVRTAMLLATRCADGWLLAAIIPAAVVLGGARGVTGSILGIVSGVLLALVVAGLKLGFRRPRPSVADLRRPIRAPDLHAFPSGHTAQAFNVVVAAAWVSPALGLVTLPLALAVGLSRVFFALHYPSDIVAGAVLGATAATVTLWAARAGGFG